MPFDNFLDGLKEILLRDGLLARTNGEHACFSADGAELSTRRRRAEAREELPSDTLVNSHGARVNLKDVHTALELWERKLDLAIEAPRAQKCGVERIGAIRCHQYFDVAARLEAIELVHDFEHSALHFPLTAVAPFKARAADGVNFVEKNNARLLRARHREELTHHSRTLTSVLLNQLAADHANETSVGSVCDGTR